MARAAATLAAQFRSIVHRLAAPELEAIMAPADGRQRLVTALAFGTTGPAGAGSGRVFLEAMIEILARHQGKIDRVVGNDALVLFGTPRAREDDPERAILCAMELREAAREHGLHAAAGIATGESAFGLMDPDEHHERSLPGPGVALAEKLRARANAGEIVVGGFTRQLAGRSFVLAELPRQPGEQERAWRIEGRGPRLEKARGLEGMRASLVGRDGEIARLLDSYRRAAGGSGRAVFVTGEAGLGKSRLAAELKSRLLTGADENHGPLWLEGRCVETGTTTAYGPFIDMLGSHFGANQLGRNDRARRVREALQSLQASGALEDGRADGIGPVLGRLLSIRFGTAWDHVLDHARAEQVRHQTFLAIRDLLLAWARGRPLLVVLDDLHWADALSIDVVARLLEAIAEAPVLLACLSRPEAGARCSQLPAVAARACPGRYAEVVLGDLDRSQVDAMIRSLLGEGPLPPTVVDAVFARSQGNPFFIEEVLRSLIESGALCRPELRWVVRDDAIPAAVPRTLEGVIRSRVDRLAPEALRLLEIAAVLGASFDRRVLAVAAGETASLSRTLAELEQRSLLVGPGGEDGDRLSFKHVLTQQAVYRGIHRQRRERLHGKAAAAMESLFAGALEEHGEQLAWHHELAGATGKAVSHLLVAGARARDAYLNDAAVRHYRHALELLDGTPELPGRPRLDALVGLGKLLDATGGQAEAESVFRNAADLARSLGCGPRERAGILLELVHTVSGRHRREEMAPIRGEMKALLAAEPDCPEAVWEEIFFAHDAFERGDPRPHCTVARGRRDLLRAMPYSTILADACAFLPLPLLLDGSEPEASEWLRWVEQEAHRHNDLAVLAAVCLRRGRDFHGQRGDLGGALEELGRAAELYGRVGARYHETRVHLSTGDLLYRFGRLDDAGECLRRARSCAGQGERHAHVEAEIALLEGQLALCRGDAASALASFHDALAAAPGIPWEWFLRLLTGCTLLEQGRREEAAVQFLAVLDATLRFRAPPAYAATVDLAYLLSLLESCDDGGGEFRAACDLVRRRRPEARCMLSQWCLEPAVAPAISGSAAEDGEGWSWRDPCGDATRDDDGGIVIAAMPGRGLGGRNFGAPRLLRRGTGDFALQSTVGPSAAGRPAVGGLVVWKSARDYLRLDRGSFGTECILFRGCIGNSDVTIGRGRLRAERVVLRIERQGSRVRALCSADGTAWFTVGEVAFPVDDPVEVGLFTDGEIRRELYSRTCTGGVMVRFSEAGLTVDVSAQP